MLHSLDVEKTAIHATAAFVCLSVCVQSCFSTFFLFEMLTVNQNEILRNP